MSETIYMPVLFKRTELGQIQQWSIVIVGHCFYTIEGIMDGTLTSSKPTFCVGKNPDKANATTPEEQAIKEAEAKHKKKIEKGYSPDITAIDNESAYFEPMLAKKLVDYKDDLSYPVLVSAKIDGSRLVARKDGCWTRNGKKYHSCPHIDKMLAPLFEKHPKWIIDTEIYSHDVPFEEIMSLVRKAKPTSDDLRESEKLVKIYIFDAVVDDPTLGFSKRFEIMKKEIKNIIGNHPSIKFVENDIAKNFEDIQNFHDRYVSEGYEGLMVRIDGKPYENKRSKNLLKFKVFEDAEFEIVDILEGLGQRSGMAGKLVCKLKNGNLVESGIRGGEDYYTHLLKSRKAYIGKKATIRFQGYTEKGSLRFPVAVNIAPIDR